MKMCIRSSRKPALSTRCGRQGLAQFGDRPTLPEHEAGLQAVPRAASAAAPPTSQTDDFNFDKYVMATAMKVNAALDAAVPMAYPETVHESIRYSLLAGGDALLAYSFEHIARETKAPPEQVVKLIAEVGRAVGTVGLVGGQVVDIQSETKRVPVETLEWIHVHKTAALLEASVVTGAIVAGASDDDVERVRQYGRNIGLCFQVVDDILDVTQSSEHLGKTAGKDLDSEKSTYPALLGIEESRDIAKRLNAEAKELLEPFDADKRAPLVGLADFIYNRTN